MNYNNMLVIQNGVQDSFFGILAIITVTVLIYTLFYIELTKKKTQKLKKAKRIVVEGLNLQRMKEQRSHTNEY